MTAKNIVLIGFMGSGKSTIGRHLAMRLERSFVDTDDLVETVSGKKVVQIFEEDGEAVFRALEKQVVREISKQGGRVVACGGGVVLDPENVAGLKENGVLVYLKASKETLVKRLKRGIDRRPLLRGVDAEKKVDELLDKRVATYESVADVVVETDALSPMDAVGVVAGIIEERPDD